MGNKHDGELKLPGTWADLGTNSDKNDLNKSANPDTQILAKAFEELSKGGLTSDERKKIELFDDILKDADIVINKAGTEATIAQDDGKVFKVKASKSK